MPLYFAYGSNMDTAAMAQRCPRSKPLGRARLMRHRFVLMDEGYASIARDGHGVVWGVLWDVALSDMRALDAYESIATGLYTKIQQTVMLDPPDGGDGVSKQVRALVYAGRASRKSAQGVRQQGAQADYLAQVIAAARAFKLPDSYIRQIETCAASGPRRNAPSHARIAQRDEPARHLARVAQRDEKGDIVVRPRFASPLERGE